MKGLLEILSFKKVLSSDEMMNFMYDNELKDSSGLLGINEIKEIARQSKKWILTKINIEWVDWSVEPKKNKINEIPPIIVKNGVDPDTKIDNMQVLDGVHRLGEMRYRGIKEAWVYMGEFF